MTSSEWEEFSQIAALCRGGNYNSINIAGKSRSAAIVAVYEFVKLELEERSEKSLVHRYKNQPDYPDGAE